MDYLSKLTATCMILFGFMVSGGSVLAHSSDALSNQKVIACGPADDSKDEDKSS